MRSIPISLYSSESREGWIGYVFPCIAQGLGKDGLDTYILVFFRALERMVWIPISLYCSEHWKEWFGCLYPCIAQSLGQIGLDTYILDLLRV